MSKISLKEEMIKNNADDYNGSSIDILEGLEAVRVRPGMYIGSTNYKGLHHLVWEILDNAIDEHLTGYCTEIELSLNKDGSITIMDNGRGIPVDLHPKKKISSERIIFTVLHAGGKFNNSSYKVAGGLHGVGSSVVNALSKRMEIEIYKNGKVYKDIYINGGEPIVELINGELKPIDVCDESKKGTKVTFYPDSSIFETIEFKPEIIKKRLREIAFLNKNLVIHYKDFIREEFIDFHEKEGLSGYIKYLNKENTTIHDEVIYISGKSQNIEVEVAFQYSEENSEQIISFCNNIITVEGGTHVTGFKTALTRIMNKYAKELGILKGKDGNFDGKDVRDGLTAIVVIKHINPQYEGQTKTKLGNTDAKGAVDEVFSMEIEKFFDKNVELLLLILEKIQKALRMRKAEEGARNKVLKSASIPVSDKLAVCSSKNPEECEIYIVEGDSAGGSAKQGRNRKFQAVLPLKGKILNVEKQSFTKALQSEGIRVMISAFGAGIAEEFDINKLKYHKIIIMTDADVDGAHIRTLLLTFFYRYMRELLEKGHIYIAQPPLYKITKGKKIIYAYNDKELEKIINEVGKVGITIQRYKGLGEMNPEQLWDTTMNPENRALLQVEIEDAMVADEMTAILMGKKVSPRTEFIFQEAKIANIDV